MSERLGLVVLAVLISFALQALVAYPAMLLWNSCFVPAVGVAELEWVQMWGIMILFNLMFKTSIEYKGKI